MSVPPLGLLWLGLAAAYFAASAFGHRPASLAIVGLIAGASFALAGHRAFAVLVAALLAIAGWHAAEAFAFAARIPPLAAFAFMAWFFGRTLRPGEVPFIVRVARMEHPDLPEDMARHATRLTALWTALFASMFLVALGLSFTLDLQDWSRGVHAMGYVAPAAFFVGELAYRSRRFRARDHASIPVLVRNVLTAIRIEALQPRGASAPQAGRS